MIKQALILIFITFFAFTVSIANDKIYTKTYFFRDGTVIRTDDKRYKATYFLTFKAYDERDKEIWRLDEDTASKAFYSIELLNSNLKKYKNGSVLITKQDGSQINLKSVTIGSNPNYNTRVFRYEYKNNITERFEEIEVPICNIKKIVFGSTQVMLNTNTGKMFPPDYKFDPYDGSPLIEKTF